MDDPKKGRRGPQPGVPCVNCGSEDAIEIDIKLPDDTRVTFYSCHHCDSRWWNRDGVAVELGSVLDLARKARG
ncbi:MAG: hypothetical protein ACE5E8_01475 [Acidimicrobiia bacterium]